MKKWFVKLLHSIGKANKDLYGNTRMDCCTINQTDVEPKHKEKKEEKL